MSNATPPQVLFSTGCPSSYVVLIPPDRDVLLHVTSSGFHEWAESAGKGKLIRMPSGSHAELDVRLAPEQIAPPAWRPGCVKSRNMP